MSTSEVIIKKYFRQRHVLTPAARKILDAARQSRKMERRHAQ